MTDLRTSLLDELSRKALELKSEHDELRELAMDICADCDGAWWGDSETDCVGHIAGYVGQLEAECEKLRASRRSERSTHEITERDLAKAVALLQEALTYEAIGANGSYKSRVREFLGSLE